MVINYSLGKRKAFQNEEQKESAREKISAIQFHLLEKITYVANSSNSRE
jgi:hypothetical protein